MVAKASRRDWTASWPCAHLLARNGGADINTVLTNLGYKPETGHNVTTVLSISNKGDITGSYYHWSGNLAGTIHVQDVFGDEAPPAILQFDIPGDLIDFSGKEPSSDRDWNYITVIFRRGELQEPQRLPASDGARDQGLR